MTRQSALPASASPEIKVLRVFGAGARHALAVVAIMVGLGASDCAAQALVVPPPPANCPPYGADIQAIAADMQLGSEEHPHGVIHKSYGNKPRLNMGNDPRGFTAIQGWGQLYASDQAGPDRSAAVELKDMRVYLLERSTRRWKLMQASAGVSGAAYREDFAGDDHVQARTYQAADGGTIATLIPGRNFHFWTTTGRAAIDPGDVAGLFVVLQARLVPDPNAAAGEHWREQHYVLSVGVDYWRDKSVAWHDWKTNDDAGIGRFKRVLPCWRDFTMTTLSAAQLKADPPPLN